MRKERHSRRFSQCLPATHISLLISVYREWVKSSVLGNSLHEGGGEHNNRDLGTEEHVDLGTEEHVDLGTEEHGDLGTEEHGDLEAEEQGK